MDRRMFRGKRTDTGDWVFGYYVPHAKIATIVAPIGEDTQPLDNEGWANAWIINAETLGQSTGLLAAKSYRGESEDARMVFEGDVLRGKSQDGSVKNFVVKWSEFRGYFIGCNSNEIYDVAPGAFSQYEIVGTVHDAEGAGNDE